MDCVPSIAAYHKNKANKERDKEGKGRRRDSGYKHVHEHQFNSSSAILCSARYPITHKALITQLISIYLITPSLPGTISTGPGRESPPPPLRASISPSPISLAPRSFDCLFLSLFFRSFSQIVDTPLLFAFLQNANRSRECAPRVHRELHDSS